MKWRAAVLALPLLCCGTWTQTGRLVDDPCVHVGVRPATDLSGAAVTLQVTTDWPGKCYRDAGVPGGVGEAHD